MKHILFLLTLGFILSNQASARAKIPVCFPCEYIQTTEDLPADTEFRSEFDDPLNVGYKYDQINILWIPIWNSGGEYCFVNDAEDTYYDLTSMEKKQLMAAGVEFPDNPLGMWDKLGGKVIILLIVALGIYGAVSRGGDDEEESKPAETTS